MTWAKNTSKILWKFDNGVKRTCTHSHGHADGLLISDIPFAIGLSRSLIFCVLNMTGFSASDPVKFQSLMQSLDFQYQARASGIAQHAELRRVEIEKEKLEKANGS